MSLDEVKEKKWSDLKDILFGSFQNNGLTKEKGNDWLELLKKAQSMGLNSANTQWNYARDHLFGLLKNRVNQDNSRKTGTDDTLAKDSPLLKALELPEADGQSTSQLNQSRHKNIRTTWNTKEYKRSLEAIKQEVLESELYIKKLNILKLEKELGLPPSQFTVGLQNHNSNDRASPNLSHN